MLFKYQATTRDGKETEGTAEAVNMDIAIGALQRRGLIVLDIKSAEKRPFLHLVLFERVSPKDIVVLSRQLSTLFEAKMSVVDSFRLLGGESESQTLKKALSVVADDIQSGLSISQAMEKHPNVFSSFYVNMILSGEESGKLAETFTYLADYLERQYELVSKAKHAMVYPGFIITAFFLVMTLMFTVVIPRLTEIIIASGQEVPVYTKIVIGVSNFFVRYGIFLFLIIVLTGLYLWRYTLTEKGRLRWDKFKLSVPYVGDLYQKLFLSRLADNLDTMLTSGISMLKAIEVTGKVVGSPTYHEILKESAETVRSGGTLSQALSRYEEVPKILTQMVRIGEETGKLGFVLATIARFYRREVELSVQTLVSLIEPIMIILLGIGVGILLTSILLPIYNIAGSL